jgi:hypothetical protein
VMKFFSFFLLFSLIAYKFTSDLPKNNYVLQFIILSIFALFFFIIITVYLAFNCFWSLSFFSIPSLDILFNLIFLSSFFPLLLIVIFLCFILYYYFCNFIPSNFFCICFFNSFFVFILLIDIFLSFSWFFFQLSLNI